MPSGSLFSLVSFGYYPRGGVSLLWSWWVSSFIACFLSCFCSFCLTRWFSFSCFSVCRLCNSFCCSFLSTPSLVFCSLCFSHFCSLLVPFWRLPSYSFAFCASCYPLCSSSASSHLFPSITTSFLLWLHSFCSFSVFSNFLNSVVCSIFGLSRLLYSSFGLCFRFFSYLFFFSSPVVSLPLCPLQSSLGLSLLLSLALLLIWPPCRLRLFRSLLLLLLQFFFHLWLLSLFPLPSAVLSSGVPGVSSSPLIAPSDLGTSASGLSTSDAARDSFLFASTSGATYSDPCSFCDVDDLSAMGEKESPALGKGESSKILHEVVNLITSFFPYSKSTSPTSSSVSFPWLDVLGASRQCDPRIFLTLFEKLAAVSRRCSRSLQKRHITGPCRLFLLGATSITSAIIQSFLKTRNSIKAFHFCLKRRLRTRVLLPCLSMRLVNSRRVCVG